jgi:hypothetical protein
MVSLRQTTPRRTTPSPGMSIGPDGNWVGAINLPNGLVIIPWHPVGAFQVRNAAPL